LFVPADGLSDGDRGRACAAKPRLLLAEDEEMLRKAVLRSLGRLLNLAGPDLIAESGVDSACRVFDLHADHLLAVVTDMCMPSHGDGIRLYRHIRAAKANLPIAIMSGGMREEEERELQGILASDRRSAFFQKPVDGRSLADWIRARW
jgi:DNA-binding NtrC family response regulator